MDHNDKENGNLGDKLPKSSQYTEKEHLEIELSLESSAFLPSENGCQLNAKDGDHHLLKSTSFNNNTSASPQIVHNGKGYIFGNDEKAQSVSLLPQKNALTGVTEKTEPDTVQDNKNGCMVFWKNYGGIILALVSGIITTIGGVLVKYLTGYHSFTLGVIRFQGLLIPGLFMVLYAYYVQKIPVFKPVWPLTKKESKKKFLGLILRSMFGTTSLLFYFFAYKKLDVADAMAIASCQPVFVTVAAYIFLREPCGVFSIFTALLTIVGVGVIVRPPILTGSEGFDHDTLIGAAFSIAGMLNATLTYVTIRYLKDVHVSLLTFAFGIWGTIQSAICAFAFGVFTLPETWEHWLLAFALAGMTLLGRVTMTLSLQWEQAGSIAVVRTSDCLFAFLVQYILLSTIPDLYSVTGASIIVSCVLLTTCRKWISTLPEEHSARKRFWFVLK